MVWWGSLEPSEKAAWAQFAAAIILVCITAYYAWVANAQRTWQAKQKRREEEQEPGRRPKLRIGPFVQAPPLFRLAPESETLQVLTAQPDGSSIIQEVRRPVGLGFYVNIPLTNDGVTLAKRCQPMLTRVAAFQNGTWQREENWIPLGLRWALDELSLRPTEERSLVSGRPYIFNLGKVSTTDPTKFVLLPLLRPSAQSCEFNSGWYCFEVTVYCENAPIVQSWYVVKWHGGISAQPTLDEVQNRLEVSELPDAPWDGPGATPGSPENPGPTPNELLKKDDDEREQVLRPDPADGLFVAGLKAIFRRRFWNLGPWIVRLILKHTGTLYRHFETLGEARGQLRLGFDIYTCILFVLLVLFYTVWYFWCASICRSPWRFILILFPVLFPGFYHVIERLALDTWLHLRPRVEEASPRLRPLVGALIGYGYTILWFAVAYLLVSDVRGDPFAAPDKPALRCSFVNPLYFSVVTAATLGYGDFSPQRVVGKLFVVLQVLLSLVYIVVILQRTVSAARGAASHG